MWVRDGGISTGRGSARVLKRSGRVRLFTIPTVASFQGKTVRASIIACFYAATSKAAAFAVAPTTGRASLLPIRHASITELASTAATDVGMHGLLS